ncbi:transposase [Paracoccus sp. pheM1]|nr:transposase [Paracoccus sp. pheM1]
MAEAGFFKTVRVKGFDALLTRTLIGVPKQVAGMSIQLSNQILGVMKTFGLIVPRSKGRMFEGHVRELLAENDNLARIILSLLDAWRDIRRHVANLDRRLLAAARTSKATQLLMTIPGIGAIMSLSFSAAIEDPDHFKRSRSVDAWLGLTTTRYQSGEIDYDGHISRRGDPERKGRLTLRMLAGTSAAG